MHHNPSLQKGIKNLAIMYVLCYVFERIFAYVLPLLTFSAILRRFLVRFYFFSILNAFGICEETKTLEMK